MPTITAQGHPVLVAYSGARNGVVHLGHSDRQYQPGFHTPAIPQCRAHEPSTKREEVGLLDKYRLVPAAYGGGVNCRQCLGLMVRQPELQTSFHRALVWRG